MVKFELSDKEESQARTFQEEQTSKQASSFSPIGGRFSYIITPTSVGHLVVIKDNQIGDEKNITEYDSW